MALDAVTIYDPTVAPADVVAWCAAHPLCVGCTIKCKAGEDLDGWLVWAVVNVRRQNPGVICCNP